LIAGIFSSGWSAVIGLAVVPLYIKYLGIEAYGLIGFFAITQAMLSLLDLGMAPTINREVARCTASANIHAVRNLLHTLALVYWGIAVMIALVIFYFGNQIADYWLISNKLSQDDLTHSVMLMGLAIGCRWPTGLYQGVLMGAQRLMLYSGINVLMVTFSSLGSIVVLSQISPTIQAFFIWQGIVGIVYAVTAREVAWRIVGKTKDVIFDLNELKRVWRFTLGMGLVSLMGIVFSQLDKMILSKVLSLEDFGYYTLATVVVSSLYLLVIPAYNVLYPQFSTLVASGELKKLEELYRLSSRMLSVVLFPLATMLAIFSEDLIYLWIGDIAIANKLMYLIYFLAIGSALNGIMHVPHALQLALGLTRLPLTINGILIVAIVPLTIILAVKYGAIGGAISWTCLHVLYVLLGTTLTHREVFKGIGKKWVFVDIGVPALLSIVAAFIATVITESVKYSPGMRVFFGAVLGLFTIVIGALLTKTVRLYLYNYKRRLSYIIDCRRDLLKPK
jgi:O-antigen/teichoic acid export membrane protein